MCHTRVIPCYILNIILILTWQSVSFLYIKQKGVTEHNASINGSGKVQPYFTDISSMAQETSQKMEQKDQKVQNTRKPAI